MNLTALGRRCPYCGEYQLSRDMQRYHVMTDCQGDASEES